MAFKKVPHDVKVAALKEALILNDIKNIATKYGISEETINNSFEKVINSIDEVIQNKKPGRKKKAIKANVVSFDNTKIEKAKQVSTLKCLNCGSRNIVKNGIDSGINWLLKIVALLLPFLQINTETAIQKYICTDCNTPVDGKDRQINRYIRQTIRLQIAKLICILRYKEGLSIRAISFIVKSIYGVGGSTGNIVALCKKVNIKAKDKLPQLNECNQNQAKMMIMDETFPKTQTSGTTNLGVIVDEHGLIRNVKAIVKKKCDLKKLVESVVTSKYNSIYFLSDYDNLYPVVVKNVVAKIIIMKDFVHTIRQFYKDQKTAINKVKVNGISHLGKEKQKAIIDLKKSLLRKRMNKVLYKMKKGFKHRYDSVGTIYIEGSLCELKDLSEQFPSLAVFYKKTEKFVKKYIDTWAIQMETSRKEG